MSDDGRRSGPNPSSTSGEHDAWLREALRHAPDASASPPPSLRDAILAEARAAARAVAASRMTAPRSLLDRALEVGFETAKTRLRYAMSKLRTCMGAYLEPLQPGGAQ